MAREVLENLAPGMRLAKPVLNPHGVLLLKADETLTEKHLAIFKAWGIREVDVVREDDGEPEVIDQVILPPEILEAVRAETTQRFRRAQPASDPVMAEILRIATAQLIRRRTSSVLRAQEPGGGPEGRRGKAAQPAGPETAGLEGPGSHRSGGQAGKGGA